MTSRCIVVVAAVLVVAACGGSKTATTTSGLVTSSTVVACVTATSERCINPPSLFGPPVMNGLGFGVVDAIQWG